MHLIDPLPAGTPAKMADAIVSASLAGYPRNDRTMFLLKGDSVAFEPAFGISSFFNLGDDSCDVFGEGFGLAVHRVNIDRFANRDLGRS